MEKNTPEGVIFKSIATLLCSSFDVICNVWNETRIRADFGIKMDSMVATNPSFKKNQL
jgi:hypothetical protein